MIVSSELDARAQASQFVLDDQVRGAHRCYPTGVTVVTAAAPDGRPTGLAVNSYASVSMEPPLIMVGVNQSSRSHPVLAGSPWLGINILAADQAGVARRFASSGGDKFAGLRWHPSDRGVPALAGTVAYLEVAVRERTPAATHTLFLAEVLLARSHPDRKPLVYLGGAFYDSDRMPQVEASP